MSVRSLLARLLSLKFLLIVSFIVLMIISGFLGYILTSIQSQKSMNELAENSVGDLAHSVLVTIQTKLEIGHQMNLMECIHASSMGVTLDNWVAVWKYWRPISVSNLRTVSEIFFYTGIMWDAKYLMAMNGVQNFYVFVEFNGTVCHDPVNFPGSNCNITGAEAYPLNTTTFEVQFDRPILTNRPYPVADMPDWKSGVCARKGSGWRAVASAHPHDRYALGYSDVFTVDNPTKIDVGYKDLFIECNAAVLNTDGQCVGQVVKEILLTFIGEFLLNLTTSNKVLVNNGRAFAFEIGNGYVTGVSHGNVFRVSSNGTYYRITPQENNDTIIAAAGRALQPFMKGKDTRPFKVSFSAAGKDFVCGAEPLIDDHGLQWMAGVILSLTDLFYDMNLAAMKMLGITAACILVLSVCAGLLISWLVTRPLATLSIEMEAVAQMDLEDIEDKRSPFYEIRKMQNFFLKMVSNLKEFRTFLPEAILNSCKAGSEGSDGDDEAAATPAAQLVSPTNGSKYNEELSAVGSIPKPLPGTATSPRTPSHHTLSEAGTPSHRHQKQHSARRMAGGQKSPRRKSLGGGAGNRQVGALTHRTVSILNVDIRAFHGMMDQEAALMATHSSIMQTVQEVSDQFGGMCSPIIGDKIMVFWNVKTVKSEHAVLCVSSAMKCLESLTGLAAARTCDGEGSCPVALSCTMGAASFGTLGTKTSRAFTVISTAIPRGALMQKLAKLIPSGVLCDGALYERIQFSFHTRLVALLSHPDPSPEFRVHEVLSNKSGAQVDEWMYELKEQENAKPKEVEFAMAVKALYSGSLANAKKYFETYIESTTSKNGGQVDILAQWYVDHAEDVSQMTHSRWGLMMPTSLFLKNAKNGSPGTQNGSAKYIV